MQAVLLHILVSNNQRRRRRGSNMNGSTPAMARADDLPKTTNQKEENKSASKAAQHRPLNVQLSAEYPLCTLSVHLLK